jgi:7-carboxy-7-deazaguanine synthase
MLRVNEVFFSIQGEGTRAGRPCVFVRLTGCPLRCSYCDSRFAFEEGKERTEEDLLEEIERFPCRLVELTGGEPLAQEAAFRFVTALADRGWEVLVETSGHILLNGLDPRAVAIMDVKTPGSGEHHRLEPRNLERLRPQDEAKLVIADRTDFDWASDWLRKEGATLRCPVLLSPAHGLLDPGRLARWILEGGLPVRLQVQLHRYLWPGHERGR